MSSGSKQGTVRVVHLAEYGYPFRTTVRTVTYGRTDGTAVRCRVRGSMVRLNGTRVRGGIVIKQDYGTVS